MNGSKRTAASTRTARARGRQQRTQVEPQGRSASERRVDREIDKDATAMEERAMTLPGDRSSRVGDGEVGVE